MGDTSGALDAFASGSGGAYSNAFGAGPVSNGVDFPATFTTGTGSGPLPSIFPFTNAAATPGQPNTIPVPYAGALAGAPGAGAIAGNMLPWLVLGGFFMLALVMMSK